MAYVKEHGYKTVDGEHIFSFVLTPEDFGDGGVALKDLKLLIDSKVVELKKIAYNEYGIGIF